MKTKILLKEKIFKCQKNGKTFSFIDLMRINNEQPEVTILMDEKTKLKYIECLEEWC